MRIFKYKSFSRFTRKEGISDDILRSIVDDLESGCCDVDLGGGVYKQRIARQGMGKSGGYRIILYFRNNDRTFFVYGFPKSGRDNIRDDELKEFKIDAHRDFCMTEDKISVLLERGFFEEIE